MAAIESILTSVKQNLGITEEYEYFDASIIDYINSGFVMLQQVGVGPDAGFMIFDKDAVWSDFIKDIRLNIVKAYMFLHVKRLFANEGGSVAQSHKELEDEYLWRLNVAVDRSPWEIHDKSDPSYKVKTEEDNPGSETPNQPETPDDPTPEEPDNPDPETPDNPSIEEPEEPEGEGEDG